MARRILIFSGPTHEYIDPVRFIGNASSGLMGRAIAETALAHGFEIDFISGPVAAAHLPELKDRGAIHPTVSAAAMLDKGEDLFCRADAIVFAAAVADYTPAETNPEKMAKTEHDLTLRLKATADIAKTLCARKRPDQVAIGFALQTSDGETNARRKLATKNLDGIVLNTPATLGAPNGTFSFLPRGTDQFEQWGVIDKTHCAAKILAAIQTLAHTS